MHACFYNKEFLLVQKHTAIIFSFIPPTGSILPVNVISPVMARFCRAGLFIAKESRADVIVHPADGPSFGVAPCKRLQSIASRNKIVFMKKFMRAQKH